MLKKDSGSIRRTDNEVEVSQGSRPTPKPHNERSAINLLT